MSTAKLASYPAIDAPSPDSFASPLSETHAALGGISWAAVAAGAVASAALSLILLFLGLGLGLSSVSPWSGQTGAAATTLAVSAIAWLTFTQIAASGVGGYLAGRLRGQWHRLHDHEVYFRDTAHGLVAWGVATLLTGALMASGISNVLGQASRIESAGLPLVTQAQVGDGHEADPVAYWTDALLRVDPASAPQGGQPAMDAVTDNSQHMQAGRVLVHALLTGSLSQTDSRFLSQLVASRTGMAPSDAQARVTEVFGQAHQALLDTQASAKQALDQARKASAYASLWMFIALLAGAFVAAWMATYGGRQRDAAILAF